MEAGLPTASKETKEEYHAKEKRRNGQLSPYPVELQIPHSVRPKISPADNIWANKSRCGKYSAEAVRIQGSGNHRSRSVHKPHPHAGEYTTEVQCITDNGISQRKKLIDDI